MFTKTAIIVAIAVAAQALSLVNYNERAAAFPRSQTGMSDERAQRLINQAADHDKRGVYEQVRQGTYWCDQAYQVSPPCGRQKGYDSCNKLPILSRKNAYENVKEGICPGGKNDPAVAAAATAKAAEEARRAKELAAEKARKAAATIAAAKAEADAKRRAEEDKRAKWAADHHKLMGEESTARKDHDNAAIDAEIKMQNLKREKKYLDDFTAAHKELLAHSYKAEKARKDLQDALTTAEAAHASAKETHTNASVNRNALFEKMQNAERAVIEARKNHKATAEILASAEANFQDVHAAYLKADAKQNSARQAENGAFDGLMDARLAHDEAANAANNTLENAKMASMDRSRALARHTTAAAESVQAIKLRHAASARWTNASNNLKMHAMSMANSGF